jgi:hypothetical protein
MAGREARRCAPRGRPPPCRSGRGPRARRAYDALRLLAPSAFSTATISASRIRTSSILPSCTCCSRSLIGTAFGAVRLAITPWTNRGAAKARRRQTPENSVRAYSYMWLVPLIQPSILMHAMGANTAGQVASVVAGGVLLALLGAG